MLHSTSRRDRHAARAACAPTASFGITDWTVCVIFIVVIGGIGSFEGPIIGTPVFFALCELMAGAGIWHFIALGVVSIGVILVEPRGLWGLMRRLLPGDLVPVAHHAPGDGSQSAR